MVDHRPRPYFGAAAPDNEWVVRPVSGQASEKEYRCPGCDHVVAVGQPHVVAWPPDLVEERRHWHTACWHRALRASGS